MTVIIANPCGKSPPCRCKIRTTTEVNINVRPITYTIFHYHGSHIVLIEVYQFNDLKSLYDSYDVFDT